MDYTSYRHTFAVDGWIIEMINEDSMQKLMTENMKEDYEHTHISVIPITKSRARYG